MAAPSWWHGSAGVNERLLVPYSISTGIPEGAAEIEGYVRSIRTQGFCVVDHAIPVHRLAAVRESVLEGRERLLKVREAESVARVALGLPGRSGEQPDTSSGPSASGDPDPDRPPMPPPELNDITEQQVFGECLVEPRVLRVAKTMLDTHVRISQTETFKSSMPRKNATPEQLQGRGWHSDWPHDLTAYGPTSQRPWMHCGAVAQPFPDVCMALSTVWYLGPEDVTPFNGGTWVVPGSHKDPRNPRGPSDGIDERAPIPGEMQLSCPAGSVLMQDTRTWHAGATNQSEYERTAVVCRYAPWWLSSQEFGNLHSGGQHVHSYVPKECVPDPIRWKSVVYMYHSTATPRRGAAPDPSAVCLSACVACLCVSDCASVSADLNLNLSICLFVVSLQRLQAVLSGAQAALPSPRGGRGRLSSAS